MITLITGGPGTGKTAWLLDQLIELRKNQPDKLLFIHGVRNLRGIAHEKIFCRSQLCDICRSQDKEIAETNKNGNLPPKFVEEWPTWKIADSLIVVDEVQRIWRPSIGGQAPMESISTLETHRHYGLDFWLISQGPHLFHNFIRLLVGRHIHLVSKWSGRTQYEWPECKQDVQSRGDAVLRSYSLPKRVYKMYDSAEIHTKQDKRKPISLYVAIISVILAVTMTIFVVNRIGKRLKPQDQQEIAGIGGAGLPAPPIPGNDSVTASKLPSFPDYKPLLAGVPESAPAYAHLIKVLSVPLLAGCVFSIAKDRCSCYTAQATPYPTSKAYCMEVVSNHRFNPYQSNQTEKAQDQSSKQSNLAYN